MASHTSIDESHGFTSGRIDDLALVIEDDRFLQLAAAAVAFGDGEAVVREVGPRPRIVFLVGDPCRSDDGQSGGMPGNSVEGIVEFQALVHDLDGAPQDVDVSPGIVTSKRGLLKSEATFDVIERMADTPCFSEEHFRDSDRINRVDLTAGKSVALTGGLEELRVKTLGIVGDQGGIVRPSRKIAKHLLRPWGISDVPISDAGVAFDKR